MHRLQSQHSADCALEKIWFSVSTSESIASTSANIISVSVSVSTVSTSANISSTSASVSTVSTRANITSASVSTVNCRVSTVLTALWRKSSGDCGAVLVILLLLLLWSSIISTSVGCAVQGQHSTLEKIWSRLWSSISISIVEQY